VTAHPLRRHVSLLLVGLLLASCTGGRAGEPSASGVVPPTVRPTGSSTGVVDTPATPTDPAGSPTDPPPTAPGTQEPTPTPQGPRTPAPGDIGFADQSFEARGVTTPTAEKPPSKLWFADGSWWGALFSVGEDAFTVHRFDAASQSWFDTGVVIDTRNTVKVDVLWDGTKLYVASAGNSSTTSSNVARVFRFSYDTASKRYTKDPGFPVPVARGGTEALVLAKDGAGVVWVVYTQGRRVMVTHSITDEYQWVDPYVLPLPGADDLTSDDIASVIAFDGRIGVMWGNQTQSFYRFAVHTDGADDQQWAGEVALEGEDLANDHINLKADSTGRVFAAVKTSLKGRDEPQLVLLVRETSGQWARHTIATGAQNQTRPIVLLHEETDTIYVIAAGPCCEGGALYLKSSRMDRISFPAGPGKPFLRLPAHPHINNPSSTKQNVTTASGLLVIAGDYSTRHYVHNLMELSSSAPADR
jgi:hypothetical protein